MLKLTVPSFKRVTTTHKHLCSIQTRTFRIPSKGVTWQRKVYGDDALQKYVFSFESEGRTFHLLGILSDHPHSNILINQVWI